MVAYLEYCLRGVRGIVTDSVSGVPLLATVSVEGNTWMDRTDPDMGDYHRILDPGTYTLTFACPGYVSKQFAGVGVTSGDATVLDVELAMAPLHSVSGTVTSETLDPLEARVAFYYHPGGTLADSTTTDPADGSYGFTLTEGQYDVEVRADGYVPEQHFAEIVGDTTFDFQLEPTTGNMLVVSDGSGAGVDLAADLMLLGFEVIEQTAGETDAATWPDYDLLVWSSGGNTSPVSSSTYRTSLVDFVGQEGRLLIEGGELAYDAISSPGYPEFADSVLHADAWNGDDVGALGLDAGQSSHPVATDPNVLPSTISIDYTGWGSQDAANPAGDAYIVYGTASYPADAGVLVYEGSAGPDHGQVVFFAFDYADLSDRAVARQLLENAVTYLVDDASPVTDPDRVRSRPGLAVASPNPFRTEARIGFVIPNRQHVRLAIYDVRGRLVRNLAAGLFDGGSHHIAWRGENSRNEEVPAGLYFCRFTTAGLTQTGKIVKIR
jgi:hypothetical protein